MSEPRKSKKSEPVDWLTEALTLTRYFDYYGGMFDERQRAIFEDYICNDMSLSEIAEREGMTRQGVSDIVKRTSRKLHEYEECLQLAGRHEKMKQLLGSLDERVRESCLLEAEKDSMLAICRQLAETL